MFLFTPSWTSVTDFTEWFTSPKRVLFPLLLILLVCSVSRARSTRWVKYITIALSLSYLLLISPVGAFLTIQGLTYWLPPDIGQEADAIVVLGRGHKLTRARIRPVAELWKLNRAPMIFMSGGQKDTSILLEGVAKEGVPNQYAVGEQCSETTEENAIFSSVFLDLKGIQNIILVTDPPHMLRSVLTFRSFGFRVIPYMAPPDSFEAISKRSLTMAALALREYTALIKYWVLGRYQTRLFDGALSSIQSRYPHFNPKDCAVNFVPH